MDNLKILKEITEARNLNKPLLLKGLLKDNPTWEYAINYSAEKFNAKSTKNFNHEGFLKNKNGDTVSMFRSSFLDIQIWDIDLPECNIMKKTFNIEADSSAFKILMDFLPSPFPNNIHKDYAEVYSWTWINSVEYRIYEDKDYPFEQAIDIHDHPYESFIIEAGDVMYMPKGTVHQSIIDNPRASLIVSIQ